MRAILLARAKREYFIPKGMAGYPQDPIAAQSDPCRKQQSFGGWKA